MCHLPETWVRGFFNAPPAEAYVFKKRIFFKDEEECHQQNNGMSVTVGHILISKMLKCEKICALNSMINGK